MNKAYININGTKYKIIIKKMSVENKYSIYDHKTNDYYCMYVELPELEKISDTLSSETYREKNTVGIDTHHYNNFNQTLEEKYNDGIEQIKEVIEEYLELLV